MQRAAQGQPVTPTTPTPTHSAVAPNTASIGADLEWGVSRKRVEFAEGTASPAEPAFGQWHQLHPVGPEGLVLP